VSIFGEIRVQRSHTLPSTGILFRPKRPIAKTATMASRVRPTIEREISGISMEEIVRAKCIIWKTGRGFRKGRRDKCARTMPKGDFRDVDRVAELGASQKAPAGCSGVGPDARSWQGVSLVFRAGPQMPSRTAQCLYECPHWTSSSQPHQSIPASVGAIVRFILHRANLQDCLRTDRVAEGGWCSAPLRVRLGFGGLAAPVSTPTQHAEASYCGVQLGFL
jgi:hypothetical protein